MNEHSKLRSEKKHIKDKKYIKHEKKNVKISSNESNSIKNDNLKAFLNIALDNITSKDVELEVRFGTKGIKRITKIDYDNVIQKLISVGFKQNGTDEYLLRCMNEIIDPVTGFSKISNIRTEITGLQNIKSLCEKNTIDNIDFNIVKKSNYTKNDFIYEPINFNDFNFRITLNTEYKYDTTSSLYNEIKNSWNDTKKIYRYINRVSFINNLDNMPFKVDLSIVKNSHKKGRFAIPEYTLQDSLIFEDIPTYEIEIELINDYYEKLGKIHEDSSEIEQKLKKIIKYILCGLQQTNFPISYVEQNQVMQDYLKLIKGDEYNEDMRSFPRDFIGPSSLTIQMNNISELNSQSYLTNIRNNYTVTDKADGDRKLLFINNSNKIYLIDTNMNVQFTGAIASTSENISNTLLDGEHIIHDKNKKYINLYAAFDIYFLNNKDKRTLNFVNTNDADIKTNFRLPLLVSIIQNIEPISITKTSSPIRISNKHFEIANINKNIFQCCNNILKQEKDNLFEYNTDGLIFTPSNTGVALNNKGLPQKTKITWEQSFKWKPSQYNTIDFLITTKKNQSGQDIILNKFNTGSDLYNNSQIIQYKTLILRVGFDERKHGYINPCNDIYEDNIVDFGDKDNENTYKPMPFYPTNPYDPTANICNVILLDDSQGNKNMITEEQEVIEDEMIVEFSYDLTKEKEWRWVPLRVRYDKTTEYRAGLKNYGNAYHVANSNWHSIHNPITYDMISTGRNIINDLVDEDIYYNRITNESKTSGLRDFHNLFVKNLLIKSVSKKGNTLIDYAVGKGGDMSKWISANLSFVFGIDISKDNIENRLDGACARYLNNRKKYKIIPSAIFIQGNSSLNIKNMDGLYTDRSKQITKAVFGQGPKDETLLGKGIYKIYGKGQDGFNISSIQFALHYMFENKNTLFNFIRNVSECTKINGYFIATAYDGENVFKILKNKSQGDNISIYEQQTKIWEITKLYNFDTFEDDESSIGYGINIYQESINKTFKEFLVNFNYLNRIMENYGFILITTNEAHSLGLPSGSAMFIELFQLMEYEIRQDPNNINSDKYKNAYNMTIGEKQISFLNRFMVYKKIRNVDAENITNTLLQISKKEEKEHITENIILSKDSEKIETSVLFNEVKKIRKLKKKLILIE